MATTNQINSLREIAQVIKEIDQDRLFRPNLGEESLKETLHSEYEELIDTIDFLLAHAEDVHNSRVKAATQRLNQIQNDLSSQVERDNAQYIEHRANFLQSFRNRREELRQVEPFFITAAIKNNGLLEQGDFERHYQEMMDKMETQMGELVTGVEEEAAQAVAEARKHAEAIEARARETAKEVSVDAAQVQFRAAQEDLNRDIKIWGALSAVFTLAFIIVALVFLFQSFPTGLEWGAIYYTSIRLAILAVLGGVAAFSMKTLRAHLHLRHHNQHRERLANSIPALIEAATTEPQRDAILAQLVTAVADFGRSGLIEPGQEEGRNVTSVNLDPLGTLGTKDGGQ